VPVDRPGLCYIGNITELVESAREHDFKILAGKACTYNGSMWYVKPGKNPQLWTELNKDVAAAALQHRMANKRKPFGSDQTVMAYMLPDAPMWGESDGIYQYVSKRRAAMVDPRIVFFAGSRKPWEVDEYVRDYRKFMAPS